MKKKKRKRFFFERQRHRGKEALASSSKSTVSQDVIGMKTVDKANRNPWQLTTKGDRSQKAKLPDNGSLKSNTSRLHHVDMSPTLGKSGLDRRPQEILQRALRGPSAVPAWCTSIKTSPDSQQDSTSPKRSAQNAAGIFDTNRNIPYSKLANTPSSYRVKRQSNDCDQPSSFFDELPEFKKLKSSQHCDSNASSSKFGNIATPGYVNGQIFKRGDDTIEFDDGKSGDTGDEMYSSLSSSAPKTLSIHKNQTSSPKNINSLPKPVFSNSTNRGPRKERHIWSSESTADENLSSLLAAPQSDANLNKSVCGEASKITRSQRHTSKPSNADNMSLPSYGIFDETRNTFPSGFRFTNYSTPAHPDALQDSSFLASQRVSQGMMDKRFRNSWLSMKDTPLVSKPKLGDPKRGHMFYEMDETRDLFSGEISINKIDTSLSPNIESASKRSIVNETVLLDKTFSCGQKIPSSINFYQEDLIETNIQSGLDYSVKLEDIHDCSVPNLLPVKRPNDEKPFNTETRETSIQTERTKDGLVGTQTFKSICYSLVDHPYSKATVHLKIVLSAIRNLVSLDIEPAKFEVETQTVDVSISDKSPGEKSSTQHSESPSQKDHDMDEIVHFGETDFSSELEVVDSTPTACSPSYSDSITADDCVEQHDVEELMSNVDQIVFSTTDFEDCVTDILSQEPVRVPSENENDDLGENENLILTEMSGKYVDKLKCEKSSQDSLNTPLEASTAVGKTSPNPPSPKIKPRPIMWPDEEMFFVKLPDIIHQPSNHESDRIDQSLGSHLKLGNDKENVFTKSVEPENIVLKITNSKPVKRSSPKRKFVPFFTSQTVKKSVPKGTEEDPIKLSPEIKFVGSDKPNVSKKSPFMIVGKKSTSKAKSTDGSTSCTEIIQLDGNISVASELSMDENRQELSELNKKCFSSESAEPFMISESTPNIIMSTVQEKIEYCKSLPKHDINGHSEPGLPSNDNQSSNNIQPKRTQSIYYSQQLLSTNQRPIVMFSSQPISKLAEIYASK
ncbi:uncharacterized protein LOC134816472 isoform X2 [Bolinopsis microptera]|uniref:uncharacterized protein LOC134816472 isoform X2 n=1 Tax=Bolinopsis microptera TaxID=2820187 RepID=UPI0030794177